MLAVMPIGEVSRCAVEPSFLPRRSRWPRSMLWPPTSWCGGRRGSSPRRTRRSGRSSRPSSRTAASRSTSSWVRKRNLADLLAALEGGRAPPDFIFTVIIQHYEQSVYEDGSSISRTPSATFPTSSTGTRSSAPPCPTGRRGLYLLPMGFATHHVHAWKSLMEQAGLHTGGDPWRLGRVLGFMVRPGPARGARGAGP
jgi:hypothetical protein